MTSTTGTERVAVNTALMSGIGLVNRALTIVTQIVIASRFGRSAEADAFFAVEIIPDLFIVLVGSGLSMAAIPVYGRLRTEALELDGNAHRDFAASFIGTVTLLFLSVTTLLYVFAPQITSMLAPGFDQTRLDLTTELFRLMVLVLAFLGPEAGLRAMFHSHRAFAIPDLARFAYNLLLLAFTIVLSPRLGVNAIGWGMVAGAAAMMALLVARAIQMRLLGRPSFRLHPAIPSLLRAMPAVLVVLAWPMILPQLDRMQASDLEVGTLSSLGYASRIALLPIGIVVLPIASAVYPKMSELAKRASSAELGRELLGGLRATLFIVLPLTASLIVARNEVIELLFQHGEFDEKATEQTSRAALFYLLGLPGLAVIFFLRNAYVALDRAWSLCWLLVASWAGAWGLNVVLGGWWGTSGIAAATALTATATAVAMVAVLAVHCEVDLGLGQASGALAAMALLSLTAGAAMATGYDIGAGAIGAESLGLRLVVLALTGGLALAGYAVGARAVTLGEAMWLFGQLSSVRARAGRMVRS